MINLKYQVSNAAKRVPAKFLTRPQAQQLSLQALLATIDPVSQPQLLRTIKADHPQLVESVRNPQHVAMLEQLLSQNAQSEQA